MWIAVVVIVVVIVVVVVGGGGGGGGGVQVLPEQLILSGDKRENRGCHIRVFDDLSQEITTTFFEPLEIQLYLGASCG